LVSHEIMLRIRRPAFLFSCASPSRRLFSNSRVLHLLNRSSYLLSSHGLVLLVNGGGGCLLLLKPKPLWLAIFVTCARLCWYSSRPQVVEKFIINTRRSAWYRDPDSLTMVSFSIRSNVTPTSTPSQAHLQRMSRKRQDCSLAIWPTKTLSASVSRTALSSNVLLSSRANDRRAPRAIEPWQSGERWNPLAKRRRSPSGRMDMLDVVGEYLILYWNAYQRAMPWARGGEYYAFGLDARCGMWP